MARRLRGKRVRGTMAGMLVLFTDFGLAGPYTGQMKARLYTGAPGVPVVDLFADAPAWNPQAAAYLLAAYAPAFPPDSVFLCVVDPGVGTDRLPLVVEADGRRYVGPDNGLFEMVLRRAERTAVHAVSWHPGSLSASFHGRDLFAPVAACLARGESVAGRPVAPLARPDWPDDWAAVVYVDVYGNVMTGLRGSAIPDSACIIAGGCTLARAETFGAVAAGDAFWYVNANGLVELAVNRGRADRLLGLAPGAGVTAVIPDGAGDK